MPRARDFVELRKGGTSLVITLPKGIGQTLNWKEGDELFLEIKEIGPNDSFLRQQIEPLVLQVSKTKVPGGKK